MTSICQNDYRLRELEVGGNLQAGPGYYRLIDCWADRKMVFPKTNDPAKIQLCEPPSAPLFWWEALQHCLKKSLNPKLSIFAEVIAGSTGAPRTMDTFAGCSSMSVTLNFSYCIVFFHLWWLWKSTRKCWSTWSHFNLYLLAQRSINLAPPRRLSRFPARWFHFKLVLSMREPKASPSSFAFSMSEEEGIFDSMSAHLLATAANIFGWAGDPTEEEVASAIASRHRPGKCRCDKQALQIFLGRLQLDDGDVVLYKGTNLHVPADELWKDLGLDVHGVSHLSPR